MSDTLQLGCALHGVMRKERKMAKTLHMDVSEGLRGNEIEQIWSAVYSVCHWRPAYGGKIKREPVPPVQEGLWDCWSYRAGVSLGLGQPEQLRCATYKSSESARLSALSGKLPIWRDCSTPVSFTLILVTLYLLWELYLFWRLACHGMCMPLVIFLQSIWILLNEV